MAWNSPDWEQIRHLQENVYQFSFAKCNEQLKAITAALYDSAGNIVPFTEFREIANRINGDYTGRYLPIEYNTAIASAQMASRWVQFNEEKDIFPNLTYRTVGDKNVRPSHKLLDGLTRPIDDDVWDTIYTPNGWGCRCDIEQSTDNKITSDSKIILPTDTPDMFKTNLAKTGLVFPKDHPYFEHLSDAVKNAAHDNNPFLYEKVANGKRGGYVYDNPLHNKGDGYEKEMHIAKVLANKGDKVVFLPEINPQTEWKEALRELVLPANVKGKSNPDAFINGTHIVEFKTSSTNTTKSVRELIKQGAKQANIICVKLTNKTPTGLKRAIKGQVSQSKSIDEVWIIDEKDKVVKYTRDEILNFFKSKKQQ